MEVDQWSKRSFYGRSLLTVLGAKAGVFKRALALMFESGSAIA